MHMNAPTAPGVLDALESSDPDFTGGAESKDELSIPIRQGALYDALVDREDGARNMLKPPTQFRRMCSSVVSWHHGGINE
jgi:hypothetical protein